MVELKNNFSKGLDMDTSYFQLPPNAYVSATNITRDAIASGKDNVISNIVGNRIIEYTFPAGVNTCIGSVPNPLRKSFVSLVYNTNGFHSIVEYDLTLRTATKVLENLTDTDDVDILGFTLNEKITGINIFNRDEGDFLFFLDSLGRPTFLNLTLFKAGTYTPVTRQIIDVAKIPPPSPPDCVYGNDVARPSNYCQKKLFRFKYRRVYDDNFKSTYSPISSVPLPVNILNPVFTNVITNNNFITVEVQSGPKNVKGIEIAVSIQNNQNIFGRFQTVIYIDKEAGSIDDDISFDYNFYNDSTYPYIDDEESNQIQDYVPPSAISQEMPNGNTLCYGAITEGYDRTLEPNVVITINTTAAGSGSSTGSLNAVVTIITDNSLIQVFQITFSGVPAPGTSISITILIPSTGQVFPAANYTTVAGDTSTSVATAIASSFNTIGQVFGATSVAGSVNVVANALAAPKREFNTITVNPPTTVATTNSISTWPFWGQRRLGLSYYDEQGRTNGILYDVDVSFPGYAENGARQVLLPYINAKIFHVPPIWAYSYQIDFTKDNTQFLYIETVDVNTDDTVYLYFDITNLGVNQKKNPTTANVVQWSFQDGDRMRLIRRMADNVVYGTAYDSAIEGIVVAPTINNVVQTGKTFVKIRRVLPFTNVVYTTDFFIIQLYRPSLQAPSDENATFFECGVQFPILNPGTNTRIHGGAVTNQSTNYVTPAETNIYDGDVYFRQRLEYLSETGIGLFNVQDRNFVDFFISAVNNIDGRPSVIDINAKETFFPSLIRYSQFYQPNTNINGLNRFYADRFLECDYSYGSIMRFKVRDRFMRVFQKLKVGMIPIFNTIGKTPEGGEITLNTDRLLNPISYYAGDYGIGTQKESLASFNYADYFTSDVTSGVYRASLNGIEPISVLYKMNSWAVENLPPRTGNYKVYGAYDQKLNNYIMALEQSPINRPLIVSGQGKLPFPNPVYFFRLVNNPVEGDIVSTSLTDGNGVNRIYTHPVQLGDTVTTIYTDIAAQINADIYFIAVLNPIPGITQVTSNNPNLYRGLTTVTLGQESFLPPQTLVFSEEDNTFESFYTYYPENMTTVGTTLISFHLGQAYTHDAYNYNTFFDEEVESDITLVFSDASPIRKQPMSLQYSAEGGKWDCPEIITNVKSYGTTNQQTNLKEAEFELQEGLYAASIKRDSNSRGGKINGDFMKSNWVSARFRKQNATDLVTLDIVICKLLESQINVK